MNWVTMNWPTWVHRDVDGAGRNQPDLRLFKNKTFDLLLNREGNLLNLLRDDRENLQRNPVELIETAPSTGRSEALEKFGQLQVIHRVGTVKNDTLHR